MPSRLFDVDLANRFVSHLEEKIEGINKSFCGSGSGGDKCAFFPDFPYVGLSRFETVTYDEINKVLRDTKKTCCDSDPYPIREMEKA